MKIILCGPPRHGKDTVADMLYDRYALRSVSSSRVALNSFLFPILLEKYGLPYITRQEAYDDRYSKRKIWYDEIKAYTADDPSRLCREILRDYDVYTGLRDRVEFLASKPLADLSLWVDARGRVPVEGEEEFADKLSRESDCDLTIDNSGDVEDLRRKLYTIFDALGVAEHAA